MSTKDKDKIIQKGGVIYRFKCAQDDFWGKIQGTCKGAECLVQCLV